MYIDTHAHLYVEKFDDDIDLVIQRAVDKGVFKILLPNIDEQSVKPMLTLSDQYPDTCFPMLGLHPCSVTPLWRNQVDDIMSHMDQRKIVGIGEIGIDLYWDTSLQREQEEAFQFQLDLARTFGLPIAVHSRNSLHLTYQMARDVQDGSLTGVYHCFTGDYEMGKKIVDAGFYLGIGGVVTFKKSAELREALKKLPLDRLILETDAPYLTPSPHRSKRNESSYIPLIAASLADIFNLTLKEIEDITYQNSQRLFNLD